MLNFFITLRPTNFLQLMLITKGEIPNFSSYAYRLLFVFSDFNPMFNWAFRTTENVVRGAVTFSAPIVQKFDAPINFVDQTFVKGLDKLEEKVPVIKEQPGEILNQAKAKVMVVVQPQIDKVCSLRRTSEKKAASLKELSYNKAKEVLATSYGSMAVTGIDNTAVLAERLLDSFFPKTDEDDVDESDSPLSLVFNFLLLIELFILVAPISAEQDPVLHTVQTIGRLNNKVARRVYHTVSRQIKLLKKEDLTEYAASLIAVLRLTQYLNFLNERVQQHQHEKESAVSNSKAITAN